MFYARDMKGAYVGSWFLCNHKVEFTRHESLRTPYPVHTVDFITMSGYGTNVHTPPISGWLLHNPCTVDTTNGTDWI